MWAPLTSLCMTTGCCLILRMHSGNVTLRKHQISPNGAACLWSSKWSRSWKSSKDAGLSQMEKDQRDMMTKCNMRFGPASFSIKDIIRTSGRAWIRSEDSMGVAYQCSFPDHEGCPVSRRMSLFTGHTLKRAGVMGHHGSKLLANSSGRKLICTVLVNLWLFQTKKLNTQTNLWRQMWTTQATRLRNCHISIEIKQTRGLNATWESGPEWEH